MTTEDDLTWLARNVHKWNPFFTHARKGHHPSGVIWCQTNGAALNGWYSEEDWLARRAELQNKPSWEDAPDLAKWLAQGHSGLWWWYGREPAVSDSFWTLDGRDYRPALRKGEVLGDWRDTLELRPEPDINVSDASCPACGSKGIHACLGSKADGEVEDSEDMIERIYWEFDSERAKKLNPERDIFKRYVRSAMKHASRSI